MNDCLQKTLISKVIIQACSIKGLLDPITMMNIDINVKNSLVMFEQLQNGQNNIIHVTKTRGFRLFSVMQPTSPIDTNFGLLLIQLHGAGN